MKKLLKKLLITFVASLLLNVNVVFAEGSWIPISGTMFVADTFNGVDAVYTENYNSGSDVTYCCAAYVKKYYKAIHNVTVYNLTDNGPLRLMEGGNSLIKVDTPQAGDILFWPTSKNNRNHSAIVKKVNGNTITLIEQNYKSNKKAMINRTVTYPSDKFEIWRLSDTSGYKEITKTEEDISSNKSGVIVYSFITKYSELIQNATKVSPIKNVTPHGGIVLASTEYGIESYFLSSEQPMNFTISNETTSCWYYNGSVYVPAKINELISATKAYVSFNTSVNPTNDTLQNEKQIDDAILLEDNVIVLDEEIDESIISFSDVPEDNWAYEYIQKCVSMGIIKGNTDGTFKPDDYVTREQFAVMLARAANLQPSSTASTYLDVKDGYYAPFIEAVKYTMMKDDDEKYFRPTDFITREDVIASLIKVMDVEVYSAETIVFNDIASASNGMSVYLYAAYEIGLVKGFSDNTIKPLSPIKRSEAASLFARAFGEQ